MADDKMSDHDAKIRKLRKKLRQIENLQRLSGLRDLSEEETTKVMQRDEFRQQLQELLTLAANVSSDDDDLKAKNMEEDSSKQINQVFEEEAEESQEARMDSEEDFAQKSLPDGNLFLGENGEEKKANDDEKPCGSNEENTESPMEQTNVTDDRKVQKKKEKKNTKELFGGEMKQWKDMNFSVKLIEGHEHPVCSVDSFGNKFISGGHDTSLKLWDSESCEELFSLGGHTGSISSVCLISEKRAITGSQDCSVRIWDIENGTFLHSFYVYSPVKCLAYKNDILAIGNEGGKIEVIYGVESQQARFSVKAHEEAVVSLKFIDDFKLASASSDGIIKIFEYSDEKLVQIFDSYDDVTGIQASNNDNNPSDTPNSSLISLPIRKINCMATFGDVVFWGDDGLNIKALNILTGQVVKLRNNLSEYSPTDSIAVLSYGDSGWLFSAGFDIDSGHGYINVRKLPSMEYVGTISNDCLGHISCISPSLHDGRIRIITGGSELRIWEQQIVTNSKKRPASDEIEDVIPCKFNCSYNKIQDSENEIEDSSSETEKEAEESTDDVKPKPKTSWCVLQ